MNAPAYTVKRDVYGFAVVDANGNEIAHCKSFGVGIVNAGEVAPWHKAEEHARLIASAFGSHADILAAFRPILAEIENTDDDRIAEAFAGLVGPARAAMDKADTQGPKREAIRNRDSWRAKAERDEHPGRGFCLEQAERWDRVAKATP